MSHDIVHPDGILAKLHAISQSAIPREMLQEGGFIPLVASSDLHPHGYTIRHWHRMSDHEEVLEYLPRMSALPRITACCYAEQVEIHLALGLNVVGPGQRWEDYGQRGLFDETWAEDVA